MGQWVVRNASELAREVARARYSLLISDSYVCGLGLTGAPIERETATSEEMRLSSAVGESDSPWAVWTVDSASPAVASAMIGLGISNLLSVPIGKPEAPFGQLLLAQSESQGPFTDADLSAVSCIGRLAGAILDPAPGASDSSTGLAAPEEHGAYWWFVQAFGLTIFYDHVAVLSVDQESWTANVEVEHGDGPRQGSNETPLSLQETGPVEAVVNRIPAYIRDASDLCPWRRSPGLDALGYRSQLNVPLIGDDRVLGVLVVSATAPEAFDDRDESIVCGFAALMTPVVDGAAQEPAASSSDGQLLERLSDGVCVSDADGTIIFANLGLSKMMAQDLESLRGASLASLFPDGEIDIAFTSITSIGNRSAWSGDAYILGPRGTPVPVHIEATPVCDQAGRLIETVCVFSDRPELRQVEAALRDQSEIQRTVFGGLDEGVLVSRANFIIMANDAAARIVGVASPSELQGESLERFLTLEDLERTKSLNEAQARGEQVDAKFRHQITRADGVVRTVEGVGSTISLGGESATLFVLTDVSERESSEQALIDSENLYQTVVDSMTEGVAVTVGEEYLFANDAYLEIHGATTVDDLSIRLTAESVHPDDYERVFQRIKDRPPGEVAEGSITYRVRNQRTGEWVSIERHATPVVYPGQNGRLVVVRDVTERDVMEQTLRQSEEQHRALINHLHDPAMITSGGLRVFVNAAFLEFHGLSDVSDAVDVEAWEYVHDEDRERVRQHRLAQERGDPVSPYLRFRVARRDGEYREVESASTPIQFDGRPAVISTFRDVTEQQHVERAVRESEEMYRAVVESMSDPALLMRNGEKVFANSAYLTVHGLKSVSEAEALPLGSFIHPEDREEVLRINALAEAGRPHPGRVRFRSVRHDGMMRVFEVAVSSVTYQGKPAALSVMRDVTEQEEMARSVKESEERYRALVDNMSDPAVIHADGRRVFVNQAYLTFHGLSSLEEAQRYEADAFTHPDDIARLEELRQAQLRGEAGPRVNRFRKRRADGEWRTVEGTASAITYADRPAVLHLIRDVTEQDELDQALRRSEELYRAVVESMEEPTILVRQGEPSFANRAFLKLVGAENVSELDAREPGFWIHPDDRRRVLALRQGQTSVARPTELTRFRYITQSGAVRTMEASASMVSGQRSPSLLLVLRDITEREEYEARMRELQKMEGVGQLAAGVAHEVNNPLTVIQGLARLLSTSELGETNRTDMVTIDEQAGRALKVVQDLLSFARRSPSVPVATQMEEAVRHVLELKAYDLTVARIEVVTDFGVESLPAVLADANHLHQVFF
ncbi:MAG: PAS domain S-box protein, partial [Dehalococcoidia bacterium]